MKKLVLTALTVTLLAGTAAADTATVTVTPSTNTISVNSTSTGSINPATPATNTFDGNVYINSNVAGYVNNSSYGSGYYGLNVGNIGTVASNQQIDNIAIGTPPIPNAAANGTVTSDFSFAESLAVGASVGVDSNSLSYNAEPVQPIVPVSSNP